MVMLFSIKRHYKKYRSLKILAHSMYISSLWRGNSKESCPYLCLDWWGINQEVKWDQYSVFTTLLSFLIPIPALWEPCRIRVRIDRPRHTVQPVRSHWILANHRCKGSKTWQWSSNLTLVQRKPLQHCLASS